MVTDDEPHSGNSTLQPSGPVEYRDTLRVEERGCFAPPKPYFGDPTPYDADLKRLAKAVDDSKDGHTAQTFIDAHRGKVYQKAGYLDALADLAPLLTEAADALAWAMGVTGPYYVIGTHSWACRVCTARATIRVDELAHTPDCPWAKARDLVARLRAAGA